MKKQKRIWKEVGVSLNDIRNVQKFAKILQQDRPHLDIANLTKSLKAYETATTRSEKNKQSEIAKYHLDKILGIETYVNKYGELVRTQSAEGKRLYKIDPIMNTYSELRKVSAKSVPIDNRQWSGLSEDDFVEMYERVPEFKKHVDEIVEEYDYVNSGIDGLTQTSKLRRNQFKDDIGLAREIDGEDIKWILAQVGFIPKL